LRDIRSQAIRVITIDSERPSPFAASLLFSYVASFLYDGDAPLAERRAQALSVDQTQLRELIGESELRDLLDADATQALERQLQRLDAPSHARSADGIHDLLLSLGDLTEEELLARTEPPTGADMLTSLLEARRVVMIPVAGDVRAIAVEHASRYRDALDVPLPSGVPEALLEPVRDPIGDLALRYARTHAPFGAADFAARYGLPTAVAHDVLARLVDEQKLLDGEFRPGGAGQEWTDAGVLRVLRRRSLARLRREVEPVDPAVLGRFLTRWQGVSRRRRGVDALLDTIEQLQGAPLAASILETEILPARLDGYEPAALDALMASGDVMWVGIEPIGERDGRVALFLADRQSELLPPDRLRVAAASSMPHVPDDREQRILDYLRGRGASFFGLLHEAAGGGYPGETVRSLWNLVWQGRLTNDTLHPLRAYCRGESSPPRGRPAGPRDHSRPKRLAPASAEGRWSLVGGRAASTTHWATAVVHQLLRRYGVLTKESVMPEPIPGGFSLLYPVLKALEESGRVRRGYFVAGLGAAQFARPEALELLRSLRIDGFADPADLESREIAFLAATDPANPYGASVRWPSVVAPESRGPTRSVGARVVLAAGALVAYLPRGERQLLTWLPAADPERSRVAAALARLLIEHARAGGDTPHGMLIQEIDGCRPMEHPMAPFLRAAGFIAGALGFQASYE
jgi:ATP-dependent Lhr-like helicase